MIQVISVRKNKDFELSGIIPPPTMKKKSFDFSNFTILVHDGIRIIFRIARMTTSMSSEAVLNHKKYV